MIFDEETDIKLEWLIVNSSWVLATTSDMVDDITRVHGIDAKEEIKKLIDMEFYIHQNVRAGVDFTAAQEAYMKMTMP